jgi:hypothetical protein
MAASLRMQTASVIIAQNRFFVVYLRILQLTLKILLSTMLSSAGIAQGWLAEGVQYLKDASTTAGQQR